MHGDQVLIRICTPNRAHLNKLVKLDCAILINVDLSHHVPDLVARYTLPKCLHHITNLCHCDVPIVISIKL